MPWMIVIILLTLLDTLSSEVACIRLADIYWNVTNPIFRIDNTDHIIDVNKGNVPFEYDQVNIICPVNNNQGTKDDEPERYIIYNVSKEEYDSCRITNPNPRIIAVCDKPNQVMYFTITFRSFTPQPGGLEFLPGHDYYFVSTSTGDVDGLDQRVGGRCATHNMKVIFKVCCDPAKGSAGSNSLSQTSNVSPNVSAPVVITPETKTSPVPSASKPNHLPYPVNTPSSTPKWILPQRPTRLPPLVKPYEVPVDDEMVKESTHNADGLDKLPNKARSKNEEFANSSWTTRPSRGTAILSTLASLLLLRLLTR